MCPHIALREAKAAILRKHQPKEHRILQQFRKWAKDHQEIDAQTSIAANQFLGKFSDLVTTELARLDQRIDEIQSASGLEVFALNDAMLERSISLRVEVPDPQLKPFDETILAAVLVRAGDLVSESRRIFCTLDFDLSPVVRNNTRKYLSAVYEKGEGRSSDQLRSKRPLVRPRLFQDPRLQLSDGLDLVFAAEAVQVDVHLHGIREPGGQPEGLEPDRVTCRR